MYPEVTTIRRSLDPTAEKRIAFAELSGFSKSSRCKPHQIYDIWKTRQNLAPALSSFRPVLPLGRDQCIVGGNFRIFRKCPDGLGQDGISLVDVPNFPKRPTEPDNDSRDNGARSRATLQGAPHLASRPGPPPPSPHARSDHLRQWNARPGYWRGPAGLVHESRDHRKSGVPRSSNAGSLRGSHDVPWQCSRNALPHRHRSGRRRWRPPVAPLLRRAGLAQA